MSIVARMAATEVLSRGGGRWVPCAADDEGAMEVGEGPDKVQFSSAYGPVPWLASATHVRRDEHAQSQEVITLAAVSAKGVDDPNRDWAAASPSGSLGLTIDNPEAWGYVKPGRIYRVTIEEVRGPRRNSLGVAEVHNG